ncbi:MAG: glycosyltransferase [Candidatus Thermoplasmatota archaeon]|nr:glycosyltransferase [Candidatus Thermoplasmatota archaeon]
MDISVVVITRNAEKYIASLLDGLLAQSKMPCEIIIVDAESKDRTSELVKSYAEKYDFIKFYIKSGSRAGGRNFGASIAKGDAIAFIDADCSPDSAWLLELDKSFAQSTDAVAGKTIKIGTTSFTDLPRVEIYHSGVDITYPACNLAYRKEVFDEVNGFDEWFKEAEELDLNYRIIDAGFKFTYNENAIVHHHGRETLTGFLKQSFWYGFGRKELTLKHGSLWKKYNLIDAVKIKRSEGENIWKLIRLGIGFLGYLYCKIVGKRPEVKEKLRRAKISERE